MPINKPLNLDKNNHRPTNMDGTAGLTGGIEKGKFGSKKSSIKEE